MRKTFLLIVVIALATWLIFSLGRASAPTPQPDRAKEIDSLNAKIEGMRRDNKKILQELEYQKLAAISAMERANDEAEARKLLNQRYKIEKARNITFRADQYDSVILAKHSARLR